MRRFFVYTFTIIFILGSTVTGYALRPQATVLSSDGKMGSNDILAQLRYPSYASSYFPAQLLLPPDFSEDGRVRAIFLLDTRIDPKLKKDTHHMTQRITLLRIS